MQVLESSAAMGDDYADEANYYSAVVYEREEFLARHGKDIVNEKYI